MFMVLCPFLSYTGVCGAPGQPVIDGITPTTVDLSWKKPSDDGGALNGYVIEALKEGEKEWTEVATTTEM